MKIIVVFISLLLLLSCKQSLKKEVFSNTDTVNPIEIDFTRCIGTEKSINLTDIVDSLEYIPLETTKKSLISGIILIKLFQDDIFILTTNGLLKFDRKGKFKAKIGATGRGPEEYMFASTFYLDERQKELFILSNGTRKILVYSFDGKFKRQFSSNGCDRFIIVENSILASFENTSGQEKYRLITFNEYGDTLSVFPNYIKFDFREEQARLSSPIDLTFYQFLNKSYYRENYNDTIFEVINHKSIKPHIVLNLGKFKIPKEKRIEYVISAKEFQKFGSNYYRTRVEESNNYVFITSHVYSENESNGEIRKSNFILYSKNEKQGFRINRSDKAKFGFNNNIDGAIDIWPKSITNEGLLISYFDYSDITEQLEFKYGKNYIQKIDTKFYKMFSKINENSNPLLVIAKLKE